MHRQCGREAYASPLKYWVPGRVGLITCLSRSRYSPNQVCTSTALLWSDTYYLLPTIYYLLSFFKRINYLLHLLLRFTRFAFEFTFSSFCISFCISTLLFLRRRKPGWAIISWARTQTVALPFLSRRRLLRSIGIWHCNLQHLRPPEGLPEVLLGSTCK